MRDVENYLTGKFQIPNSKKEFKIQNSKNASGDRCQIAWQGIAASNVESGIWNLEFGILSWNLEFALPYADFGPWTLDFGHS